MIDEESTLGFGQNIQNLANDVVTTSWAKQLEKRIEALERGIATTGYCQPVGVTIEPKNYSDWSIDGRSTIKATSTLNTNLITDWLKTNGNPSVEAKVESDLALEEVKRQVTELLKQTELSYWAKYVSVDDNGEFWYHELEPERLKDEWDFKGDGDCIGYLELNGADWKQCCWKISDLLVTNQVDENQQVTSETEQNLESDIEQEIITHNKEEREIAYKALLNFTASSDWNDVISLTYDANDVIEVAMQVLINERSKTSQNELRKELISFMDDLREYVHESHTDISKDERDSSEFVDIFLNKETSTNEESTANSEQTDWENLLSEKVFYGTSTMSYKELSLYINKLVYELIKPLLEKNVGLEENVFKLQALLNESNLEIAELEANQIDIPFYVDKRNKVWYKSNEESSIACEMIPFHSMDADPSKIKKITLTMKNND